MIIRLFKKNDARDVFETHELAVKKVMGEFYSPKQIIALTENSEAYNWAETLSSKTLALVADTGIKVVGFADLDKNQENSGYMQHLYVNPSYHGQGIGSKLVKDLEALARQIGINQITLEASINAHCFYRNRGYEGNRPSIKLFDGIEFEVYKMSKLIA